MKFTKHFLIDSLREDDDCTEEVLDEIIDNSRWSILHRRVFRFEDKFYETFYSVGATEQQDERPYEYDGKEIECQEVEPVQVLVTVYNPIKLKP